MKKAEARCWELKGNIISSTRDYLKVFFYDDESIGLGRSCSLSECITNFS